ncbi:hypothetical protein Tco_0031305, partial [Tanacetum coccineum]
KSFVKDDPEFKVKENEEASHSDSFLSTQQVRELMNDVFYTPSLGLNSVKDDACVSELMDVDQPSLVKNVLDDVHIDSVVKDVEESENPRKKFPGKVYISPYTQPLSTEVKCRKRRRRQVNIERVSKRVIKTVVGSDGNEIQLLPWKEDLTRSPTAPKRTVSVPEAVMVLFRDKNRMKMRWTFPWVEDGHLVQIEFWGKLVGRSHTKRGWCHTPKRGLDGNTCPGA